MSIIKQTLYIAHKDKTNESEQLLMTLCQLSQNMPLCEASSIYQCEDESNEFLHYEQWSDENSYRAFKNSKTFKEFESASQVLIRKVEVLRLD